LAVLKSNVVIDFGIKSFVFLNVNNRIVDKIRKNTASRDYYAKSEIDKCFK
jgi:hypothetical protein